MKLVAKIFKAIRAQESKKATKEKARTVVDSVYTRYVVK